MIAIVCPDPTEHTPGSGQSPAFTSPTTSSRAEPGQVRRPPAYPSRVARAKGGKSRSAKFPPQHSPQPLQQIDRLYLSRTHGSRMLLNQVSSLFKAHCPSYSHAEEKGWEEEDMHESYAAMFWPCDVGGRN